MGTLEKVTEETENRKSRSIKRKEKRIVYFRGRGCRQQEIEKQDILRYYLSLTKDVDS
jgi:hypothetical protein